MEEGRTANEWSPLLAKSAGSIHKPSGWLTKIGLVALFLLASAFAFLAFFTTKVPDEFKPPFTPSPPRRAYTVAIIGAGPAGISAASELRRLDNGKSFNYIDITIFDRGHIIGGRLANPVVAGRSTTYGKIFPFDDPRQDPISPEEIAGAPLLSFLGSTTKTSREVGFYNGKSVYQATRPSSAASWGSWLGQLCRYGFSPARARGLAANEKFTLNDILGNGTLVSSLEEIVASMGILDHMAQTGEQRLHDESISEAYQADIVAPEVRRRFGQGLNGLNGHALAVAMYDGDQRMGLKGGRGFESHFETLAIASGASLKLDTNVAGIYKNSSREWILEVQNTRTGSQPEYMMFNAVILAAPFNSSELDFLPEPPKQSPEMLDFGACHLTLFTSTHKLCSETFDSSTDLPDTIFAGEGVRQNPDLFDFFELALVRPVTHSVEEVLMTEYLYRVLSPGLVSPSDLGAIGRGNVTWSHHSKIPSGYPALMPRRRFASIKLDDAVYHTGASESIVSSVEMAYYMGKSTAQTVFHNVVNFG